MAAAVVDLDAVDLLDLIQIADAAPDHRAAALGLVLELGRQVAAEEGAVVHLVKQVDDHDVVFDQTVNRRLVVAAHEAELARLGGSDLMQILAQRDADAGHGAANHAVILGGMGVQEVTLRLKLIALHPGRSPDFLQRQLAHALQHGSGDLRTAVLQALARPLGGELDHFFFGVKKHYIVPLVNFVFCVHDSITPNSRQAEPAVFCEVFRNVVRFAVHFFQGKQRQLTPCLIFALDHFSRLEMSDCRALFLRPALQHIAR